MGLGGGVSTSKGVGSGVRSSWAVGRETDVGVLVCMLVRQASEEEPRMITRKICLKRCIIDYFNTISKNPITILIISSIEGDISPPVGENVCPALFTIIR